MNTPSPWLWENNPNIERNVDDSFAHIHLHYETPRMRGFDNARYHFSYAFHEDLKRQLNISIPFTKAVGDIYLSDKERTPIAPYTLKPILLINDGHKADIPVKQWPIHKFQAVVDALKDDYDIFLIGNTKGGAIHTNLDGAYNAVDRFTEREYIRLMYQADAVLTGVSFPMHLCAALNDKDVKHRKCVVLAGGREDVYWEKYKDQVYLDRVGKLPCCVGHGCWKKLLPGCSGPNSLRCGNPVRCQDMSWAAKCMDDISVEEVVDALRY